MSDEEEKRLMEAIDESKNPFLRPIVVTALQTGMRKGEIINLKWANVDFKNRAIPVERGGTMDGPKGGEIRSIPH